MAFTLPPNDGYVTDAASIMTELEREKLKTELTRYRDATSNEIVVVTIPSLEGEPIEDVSQAIFRSWGIGSKSKNNGILILVAHQDRALRIEVGYGLEGAVPDLVANGIIEKDIVPQFREGNYFEGIRNAIDSLQKHIGNEYTADRYAQRVPDDFPPGIIVLFFVFLQWIIAILQRTKSWWLGGIFGGCIGSVLVGLYSMWLALPILIISGLILDYFVSKNYRSRKRTSWWAGGGWGPGGSGFGGRGGGGFGGFGGGSTGGGGASGRW